MQTMTITTTTMSTMNPDAAATSALVEYLSEHSATQSLAGELAALLVLRGRAEVVPATITTPRRRRIAS